MGKNRLGAFYLLGGGGMHFFNKKEVNVTDDHLQGSVEIRNRHADQVGLERRDRLGIRDRSHGNVPRVALLHRLYRRSEFGLGADHSRGEIPLEGDGERGTGD